MGPKRTLLAQVLEEGAELDGVLGKRGGRDRRLGWGTLERDPGCGQVPGEAARALPTRQTQVRCVCLLSKPPSGLRNERPWWWKGKLGTF